MKIGEDESNPQVTSHNITVRNLAFDGNLNTGTTSEYVFWGIWVERGEDITFRDLYFEEFFYDAISVSNGHAVSKNVLIERVRTEKINRNALHIGFAEDVVIRNCVLDKNQDEDTWGATSGNGIDVEVEGDDPVTHLGWVEGVTIEDTFIRNTNINNAGAAIALQPAYGPIDDITIRRNLAIGKGYQSAGGNGSGMRRNTNITMNQNWMAAHVSNAATGGFWLSGTDYGEFNDNIVTISQNASSAGLVRLTGATYITGSNNKFYRPFAVDTYNCFAAFMIDTPYTLNDHVEFYNTTDNGWSGSRIVHYDGTFTPSSVIGTSSTVTWITNTNSTPTNNPSITSAQISNGDLVVQTTEPNSLPVRVVALRNSLPIGMKAAVSGTTTFVLPAAAVSGDFFEVRVYNQHGREATYSFTY